MLGRAVASKIAYVRPVGGLETLETERQILTSIIFDVAPPPPNSILYFLMAHFWLWLYLKSDKRLQVSDIQALQAESRLGHPPHETMGYVWLIIGEFLNLKYSHKRLTETCTVLSPDPSIGMQGRVQTT